MFKFKFGGNCGGNSKFEIYEEIALEKYGKPFYLLAEHIREDIIEIV